MRCLAAIAHSCFWHASPFVPIFAHRLVGNVVVGIGALAALDVVAHELAALDLGGDRRTHLAVLLGQRRKRLQPRHVFFKR
jgi:hypothetical protein